MSLGTKTQQVKKKTFNLPSSILAVVEVYMSGERFSALKSVKYNIELQSSAKI